MNKALVDLIRISNMTGKDPALVRAGGGNTSVKTRDGKYMYVKASGTALKDMNAKQGWRRLKLQPVLSIIGDDSLNRMKTSARQQSVTERLLLACDDGQGPSVRPSVESLLHAILGKCVIHLHPLAVGAYVNAKNGREEITRLFRSEKPPPLWVPYVNPGFELAKKIARLVADYQAGYGTKPAVMILQKHGLFVNADTADSALRLVRKVIKLCRSKLKHPKAPKTKPAVRKDIIAAKLAIRKAIFDVTGQYLPVHHFGTGQPVAAFMARKDAQKLLATAALNPDELVYTNGPAMWLGPLQSCDVKTIARKLTSLVRKGRKPSRLRRAFLVKGLGLFIASDKKAAPIIAEVTTGSLLVRMYAAQFGGVVGLTKREEDFINNWKSEEFRRKPASRRQLNDPAPIELRLTPNRCGAKYRRRAPPAAD